MPDEKDPCPNPDQVRADVHAAVQRVRKKVAKPINIEEDESKRYEEPEMP
jgi:hypothetical protein